MCMVCLKQHMGTQILTQHLLLRCIVKPRMAIHRRIPHCHRNQSNQQFVVLRKITRSFQWWNGVLLMNQWLRMPSMNRIIVNSWLVWRHLCFSNPSLLVIRCQQQLPWWNLPLLLRQQLVLMTCSSILIKHRILQCSSQRIRSFLLMRFVLGQHSSFEQSYSYQRKLQICVVLQFGYIISHIEFSMRSINLQLGSLGMRGDFFNL